MTKQAKWRHDDLLDDLAAHLGADPNRMIWRDMQLGPSGSPRPDVYTLPKSYSRFMPMAYEVKISVSDFRSDVTSGKWQKYLDYACGVYFAVPKGLITKDDIPAGCGLIVRSENVWRVARKPTLQPIQSLPHDAWMKMLIDGVWRCHKQIRARAANDYLAQQKLRKKYGDKIASLIGNIDTAEACLEEKRKQLQSLIDDTDVHIQRQREQAKQNIQRERDQLISELVEMRKAFDLPDTANVYDVIFAMRNARTRLEEREEIKHLKRHIDRIQNAIQECKLPGFLEATQ